MHQDGSGPEPQVIYYEENSGPPGLRSGQVYAIFCFRQEYYRIAISSSYIPLLLGANTISST